MEFADRTLACLDCSQSFIFTAGEQEFYDRKGFREEPKRCKTCRDARKSRRTDKLVEEVRGLGTANSVPTVSDEEGNGNVAPPPFLEDDPNDDIGNRLPQARPVAVGRGPRAVRAPQPQSQSQPQSARASRETFDAVCAQCGTRTRVPFKPVAARPVYCKDCYGRRAGAGG